MRHLTSELSASSEQMMGWAVGHNLQLRSLETARNLSIGQSKAATTPARGAVITGLFLALLQAADGILTSMGISRFGIAMEGNPLLRSVMEQFGHVPTLAVLKLTAICVIISLIYASAKISWVKNALGAVSAVYFFAAIMPWTYILFVK